MDIHNEGLVEKFVRRGAWLYFFSFLIGPLGYAIKITLSHDLSVSEIGLLYGILSFILLVSSFNDFGMIESLNYFAPKLLAEGEHWKAKTFVVYALIAMLGTSLALGLLMALGSHWLSIHYFGFPEAANIVRIFSWFLILSNALHFNTTIFSIYQNTKHQKLAEFLRLAATLVSALALHAMGSIGITNYSWIWNYGMAFGLAYSSYKVWTLHLHELFKSSKFSHNMEHFRELFTYGFWALITMNVGLILSQIDMQLLILLKGTVDAWYYSNYLSLIGIPFIFTSPIIGFIFPVASSYSGKGDTGKLVSIKNALTRIFSVIGIIETLVFFLYGKDLGILFFGEKFQISGEILLYSIPFLVFNFLLQINFQILGWTGRVRWRLGIITAGLACNVLLNLLLIPRFGPQGSALAVGLSWIPIWYMSSRATREFAWNFDWNFFFKNAIAASIIAVVVYYVFPRSLAHSGVYVYLMSLTGACACFIGTFFVMNRKELTNILSSAKRKDSKSDNQHSWKTP